MCKSWALCIAMAPQGQAEHEHDHQHGQPNNSHHNDAGTAATSVVGDYARLVAVILTTLALKATVRYLVGRSRRARRGRASSSFGKRDRDRDSNANISDPPRKPGRGSEMYHCVSRRAAATLLRSSLLAEEDNRKCRRGEIRMIK